MSVFIAPKLSDFDTIVEAHKICLDITICEKSRATSAAHYAMLVRLCDCFKYVYDIEKFACQEYFPEWIKHLLDFCQIIEAVSPKITDRFPKAKRSILIFAFMEITEISLESRNFGAQSEGEFLDALLSDGLSEFWNIPIQFVKISQSFFLEQPYLKANTVKQIQKLTF